MNTLDKLFDRLIHGLSKLVDHCCPPFDDPMLRPHSISLTTKGDEVFTCSRGSMYSSLTGVIQRVLQ